VFQKSPIRSGIAAMALLLFFVSCEPLVVNLITPNHDFSEDRIPPPPNYAQDEYWAALPQMEDFADYRPEGIAGADPVLQAVDVFFIHPSGYFQGKYWNDPIDLTSGTSRNTDKLMLNNASIFNDCQVYAPRYRQAAIVVFTNMQGDNEQKALSLAYEDVREAFQYYLDNYNQGRPFILAGHSQGSYHGMKLIEEFIDGTELSERMIAAYLLGTTNITNDWAAGLETVGVSDSATQAHCIINFNTHAEGVKLSQDWGKTGVVCVNPLNWKRDGEFAPATDHLGYVPESGETRIKLIGADKAGDELIGQLDAPILQHTHAFCENGVLLIENQNLENDAGEGDYHGIELSLFHMNIRMNVAERSVAYLNR